MIELNIEPGGTVRAIYSDDFDFDAVADALGGATVARASHVEPNGSGGWTADMHPVGGPVLGPFKKRRAALDAEVAWLRDHLAWCPHGVTRTGPGNGATSSTSPGGLQRMQPGSTSVEAPVRAGKADSRTSSRPGISVFCVGDVAAIRPVLTTIRDCVSGYTDPERARVDLAGDPSPTGPIGPRHTRPLSAHDAETAAILATRPRPCPSCPYRKCFALVRIIERYDAQAEGSE